MEIINPLSHPFWNDLLHCNPSSSFFHTTNWASVLSKTYHYTPCYFVDIRKNRLTTLIPVMEVDSLLTGRRGVSLPFTDYCDPIIPENSEIDGLMASLIGYGKKAGWKYIEMRTRRQLPAKFTPSSIFFGHTLDLTRTEETIFSQFRESTQRNIRKAEKEGVSITIQRSYEAVKEFYGLHCKRRKEHGLPPQPFKWFSRFFDHIIAKDMGMVALAEYKGKLIAGAVYVYFMDQTTYKYGASDSRYQHLRSNNLIMWEAIRWCRMNGVKHFSFGRTEADNKGLLQFKEGWGARESAIYYYRYDMRQKAFVKYDHPIHGSHNRIFRNMPMPVLKLAGKVLYRHMG